MDSDPREDPDPELRVRRARARARVRRGPWIWMGLGLVVLAVIAWAATSTGERPELGGSTGSADVPASEDSSRPGDAAGTTKPVTDATDKPPDDSGTAFVAKAPATPSAGCAEQGGEASIQNAEVSVDGSVQAHYSMNAPSGEEPAPMLVLVSEAGQPAADLADTSGAFDVAEGWIHVAVDPLSEPKTLGETAIPELLETLTATQCVDLNRVFLVGFGDGGRAVGAAVCEAPELISGAVMVAGWTEAGCSPDPRVAIRIVGADDDPSADAGTALEEVGATWAEALGTGDQVVDGRGEDILVRLWSGPGGATVETTATVGGGHNWSAAASLAVGTFLEETVRTIG